MPPIHRIPPNRELTHQEDAAEVAVETATGRLKDLFAEVLSRNVLNGAERLEDDTERDTLASVLAEGVVEVVQTQLELRDATVAGNEQHRANSPFIDEREGR